MPEPEREFYVVEGDRTSGPQVRSLCDDMGEAQQKAEVWLHESKWVRKDPEFTVIRVLRCVAVETVWEGDV